jgi:hypothetical protein
MKCKLPIQANSHSNHFSPLESVRGQSPLPPDFFRQDQTLSGDTGYCLDFESEPND